MDRIIQLPMPKGFESRFRSRGIGLQLLLLVHITLAGNALEAADWPQFLGPKRDGTTEETGLVSAVPAAGLPTSWRRPVGAGFAGPVVAGDKVILFHQVQDLEVVECLDLNHGKTLWKFDYSSDFRGGLFGERGPRATPTIVGERVYTLGAKGDLYCLDMTTGKPVWSRALHKDYSIPESYFGVSGSPLIDDHIIFLNLGARGGAGLVALDSRDGKTIWAKTDEEASYASAVAATVEGERLILFFARSGLRAVTPRTGEELFAYRWRARIDASVNAATPLIHHEHVFLTSSYNTGAVYLKLTATSCKQVWKGDYLMSCHYNTPLIHQGFLFGIDGRQEGRSAGLRCLNLATAKIQWTKENFGCASLTYADNKIWCLDETGTLYLLAPDFERFRLLGKTNILTSTCRAHPALAQGRFLARDQEQMVCIDLRNKP